MPLHADALKKLYFFAVILLLALPAYGHGAQVSWAMEGDSVHIRASFDDGLPMSEAQVSVFTASAPTVPCITGLTDDNGSFLFFADASESTDWDVQVRKAGHGDIIHFSLADETVIEPSSQGFSVMQIVLMSASIVWGFIGTALFFSSKKTKTKANSNGNGNGNGNGTGKA